MRCLVRSEPNLIRRHRKHGTTVAIFAQQHPQLGRTERAAFVSEIYEWLLRDQQVAVEPGSAFALRIGALLAATKVTSYQHETLIDEVNGIVRCDCSGLIGFVLCHDELFDGDGDDVLQGGDGDDLLKGDKGEDELHGDSGHDRLFGGDDDDLLFG